MIKKFRSRALKRFAATGDGSKLSVPNTGRVARMLRALDGATSPNGMNLPGSKFHSLKGHDKGGYSVWVTGNYRITFAWTGVDATDVDMEDYH